MKAARTNVIFIRKKPKSLIPFSKEVSITFEALCAIVPKIVLFPVCMTNAFALPLTIFVPSQRQFVL